jgi:Leucine-rich repeat (LRR) protein
MVFFAGQFIIDSTAQIYTPQVSDNRITGSIPEELWQISGLQQLRLGSNRLSGTLSNAIGNLGAVKELLLNDNQLEGSVPLFLGRLSTLGTWVSRSRVKCLFESCYLFPSSV